MHSNGSTTCPNNPPVKQQSAFGLPAAQIGHQTGVRVPPEVSLENALRRLIQSPPPSFDGQRCHSTVETEREVDPAKQTALTRPCISETLEPMGTMGSPFDAPLPRFQQAAAHLSSSLGQSSSKKPPLSPSLPESKSLKAYDERAERQVLAEFAQSKSLERSASFTRRRNSRQDLMFAQANSLASVVEHSCEAELASLPSSSAPEPLLLKTTSLLPAQSLLSTRSSFFSQRLPGFLAAIGMLLLLVMSVVALWPPGNGAPITPRVQSTLDEASFPRKVFDRLFGGGSTVQPLRMEHFTAAQGSELGTVGFGLEDPTTSVGLTRPAIDFESFVSTHLGFESEDEFGSQQGQSRADFVAAFQRADALNDDMSAHAGAYGEGLVAAALAAQGQARPTTAGKTGVEGRKELEGDDSSTSSDDTSTSTATPTNSGGMGTGANGGINGNGQAGTAVTGLSSASLNAQTNTGNKKGVGVIPQESVLPAGSNPLSSIYANSGTSTMGTASTTSTANTIAANPQTSSKTGSNGGTNTNAQLDASTNTATGSFSMGASTSGSSSATTSAGSVQDVPGRIAVQPFAGGTNTASSTSMGATAVVGTNSGSSASGLRHKSTGQGRAASTASASQTTPLDSVSSGQVTSVASSDLSSSQTTGQRGLVGQSATSSFQPLSGRKLRSGRRLLSP